MGGAASHLEADSSQRGVRSMGGGLLSRFGGERLCRGAWWMGVSSQEAGVTPRKAQRWGLAATKQTNK